MLAPKDCPSKVIGFRIGFSSKIGRHMALLC
jgi:hypothetical protein